VLVDEELHVFFNDEARAMSAFLYGRRLYEVMTAYWPTAETDASATPAMLEFARIWKDTPKIVFSRTLEPPAPGASGCDDRGHDGGLCDGRRAGRDGGADDGRLGNG
jgi:hypothetical protein